MALADQAGLVTVQKIDSETLPHVAQIINDTLQQAAVMLSGTLNGIEGERVLAMNGLKDDVIAPLLEESKAWRRLIENGFEGTVNGNIPFTIQGKAQAK